MTAMPPMDLPEGSSDAPALPPAQTPRRMSTARTVGALMLREMATTYGRSPGGYIWALLEPVGMIAMLSIVFSFAVRTPSLGDNFPLFYASGILPYSIYTRTSQSITACIRYSRSLLAYPAVTFVDAIAARFLLGVITQMAVMILILTGIAWVYDIQLVVDLPLLALAVALAALLGLGVGTLNCFLVSMVPVWTNVWAILTRPLLFVSAVLFVMADVPTPYRDVLAWNPIVHPNELARAAIFSTYDGVHASPGYTLCVSLITLFFGMLLLGRYHRDILSVR